MGKLFKIGIVALPLLAMATQVSANQGKAHQSKAKAPAGVTRTPPWNSDTTNLDTDKSIIYGRLANGLRYAIRPNNRPENQVLVRLAFDFGSAAEADNEQGLAHFIEHMAFNGSTHVPEGEMVKMLERLGLAFGADTNASTGFTMTDYRLDLPKSDPALIERALFLMRETASEITFDAAAVDRERGVVIAEMRQRENYQFQRNRAQQELFYPGSFYATRYPIGKKEILETAPAERLKALYRKWYTPDRARIVVVGPVDPVAIEREIARKFGDWKGSSAALGAIDQCRFDTARRGDAGLFVHPEINEVLNIERILPDKKRPDNFETNLLSIKMNIAASILQDRLSRKARKEDIPFLGGGSSFAAGFCDQYARVGMTFAGKDGSWQQLMPLAEQSVRQAAEYGFGAQEVAEQLTRLDAAFENARKGEATNPSSYYANQLARLDDDVISSAEQQQMLWRQLRPFMTADAISAEFAKWFGQLDDPMIFLSTRKGGELDKQALASAFADSRKVALNAPATRDAQAWAYTDFGAAGTVVDDKQIADLGIRTIRFSNGVLLNLKKTAFEADRIRWSVRIDGGTLALPRDKQYLASFMNGAFAGGGLGKYDQDDLRALLSGSTAQPGLYAGADNFGASGAVVPKDLERQMQLTAAFLTDPGKRQEAVRLFRRGLPEFYSRLDATPQSALGVAVGKIMNGDDPRFIMPDQAALTASDFPELDTALGNALSTNRIEIGLVGAIDEDAAIAVVARTFGALPARKAQGADYADARKTVWSGDTGNHDVTHRGEANQLSWRRTWTTSDDSDYRLQHALDILANIVQIRLLDELREKLGATYGASADSDMSSIYPGRGTFTVSTDGDPKDLAAIEAAVDAVIAQLIAAPVSADLFERARKPTLEAYADWKKQNGTWARLTAEAQTDPRALQRFRISEDQYKSITPEEVQAAAKKMLEGKATYTFRAVPVKGGAVAAAN
jgi:zinc protease